MRKPEYPFVAQEDTEASWATTEKLREQLDAAQQQIAALRVERDDYKAKFDRCFESYREALDKLNAHPVK